MAGSLNLRPTIQVMYSCALCGLVDAKVTVLARMNEDVVSWVNGSLVTAIARDHRARSPRCNASEITEIKIPLMPGGSGKVGGAVEN